MQREYKRKTGNVTVSPEVMIDTMQLVMDNNNRPS